MALRERAALGILAGQAHRMAFFEQRAERQRLASRPVDALAAFDRLGAIVEEALDRLVDVEALRHRGDLLADRLAALRAARRYCRGADRRRRAAAFRPDQRPSSQSALLGL